jgi:glutamate dehydrogenase (NAD(P)+)
MGGSLGRTEATGYGVIYVLREALKELGISHTSTASIQGFGNVARYAAELFIQMGGTVISIACWDQADKTAYTYRKKEGINLDQLCSISDRFGGIDKNRARDLGYEVLAGGAWIEQDVDILLPAALENQINRETVKNISKTVKIIAEGANGPTTPKADEVLKQRKIFVIPDFLANAGGVTCSYFEQVQSNTNYFWEKEEVFSKLDTKMTSAFASVYDLACQKKLYMRDAAYTIAINRVAQAVRQRGWA